MTTKAKTQVVTPGETRAEYYLDRAQALSMIARKFADSGDSMAAKSALSQALYLQGHASAVLDWDGETTMDLSLSSDS